MEKSLTCGAIAVALLLASCSGPPSDGSIKDALERDYAQRLGATAAAASAAGSERIAAKMVERLRVTVRSVNRNGCRADGANAFRCDVALELEQGGVVTKVNAPLKLARGSGGWVLVHDAP